MKEQYSISERLNEMEAELKEIKIRISES